jgi:hypothetical protein
MNRLASGIFSMGMLLATASAAFAQKPGAAAEKNLPPASTTAGKPGEKNARSPSANADKSGENKVPPASTPAGRRSDSAETLDPSEAAEVQKYGARLKRAGLSAEDVDELVRDETEGRLSAKRRTPPPAVPGTGRGQNPSVPNAAAPSKRADQGSPGMGPYVQELLARGLRGQELADAIHAEKARRHSANGNGLGRDDGQTRGKGAAGHPDGARGNNEPGNGKSPGSPQSKPPEPTNSGAGGHGKGKPHQNAEVPDQGKPRKRE